MRAKKAPRLAAIALALSAALVAGAVGSHLGDCGPFTDVADPSFCNFVLEILYLGITSGTSATTYNPGGNVTRIQMAKFLSITVDSALKRGSRRAALDQFWTVTTTNTISLVT